MAAWWNELSAMTRGAIITGSIISYILMAVLYFLLWLGGVLAEAERTGGDTHEPMLTYTEAFLAVVCFILAPVAVWPLLLYSLYVIWKDARKITKA
ncbi:hypothetical protein A2716_04890 [candidate division WWE3 bacterium RIFCSPHIGHO2_01_FULL_40_23]|uniref:Uncharacterized protein n=1 Tax=candidate division WWE3 bacterium RIFCSPLOWO2_01_FULL_41_18 TaxID=1802625 RepID=A0A1F4VD55_UNCKA|nr:MAG: hypothetical protein A2716_04890 [candidate division WWE3 bacterium RIFCSPHIGHO2_01_FULL_40_23]OGC55206.1 MAG: hypothetical protein A3A78_04500 [candidate division WWE3 bacterium RIFCSPLOWO2_01_FULL_41_18]